MEEMLQAFLEKAEANNSAYADILAERAQLRDTAKVFRTIGSLTEEQQEVLDEYFPVRTRNRGPKVDAI